MECFQFTTGILTDLTTDRYASVFKSWSGEPLQLSADGTHFGFVYQGEVDLLTDSGNYRLRQGMYFSLPSRGSISPCSTESQGMVISRLDYYGFFQVGGPIENTGRLQYIDGCTDSLLISPVLLGDPCLNLLHIPSGTKQTVHTHPSLRLGMIVSGRGTCVTPKQNFPLNPGTLFHIPAEDQHSFHTHEQALRVIAYHPDSDFGPTHQDHPMVNKTIIANPT